MKEFSTELLKPFLKQPDMMRKLLRGAKRKYITASRDKRRGDGVSNALWLISMRITDRCNQRCAICGQYGRQGYNKKNIDLPKVKGNVPIGRYKEMIDNISHLKPHIYITGGEPFLYPDGVIEFGNYCKKRGLSVQIVTNGVRLEETAKELVDNEWDMVCVSVDGPQKIHDKCRGLEGSFETMKTGVEEIQTIKNNEHKKKPMIFTLTTLWRANYEHLVETIKVSQNFHPDASIVYYSWFTSQEVGEKHSEIIEHEMGITPFAWKSYVRDNTDMNLRELERRVRLVKSTRYDSPVVFVPNISLDQIEPYYKDPTDFLGWSNCLTPWIEANIMPNGDVVSCRDFPDVVMGNLMKDTLLNIFNCKTFRKFRRALSRQPNGVFPLCSRCCGLMGF
ncbi:MAG: radical SAM/SPASM domain-containing protein [Candidatus Bathyarchaeia archaeon]